MTKFTVEQDMKLGSALDQLEDAIAAAQASLRMVKWAQLNVARYAGGVLGPEVGAKIRNVPLDLDALAELTHISRKLRQDEAQALSDFIESHNHKIITLIEDYAAEESES
jgi:hypothetical protein